MRPRKSVFSKWQQGSDKLFNKASSTYKPAVKKETASTADGFKPKVMKTKDSKSWMVQL